MTTRAFIPAFVAATLCLTACSGCQSAAADRPEPATHTITIAEMRFQPESLTVNAGDTVVWINKDLFPHTATSQAGAFNSSAIEAGRSWQFTPATKGAFAYVCTFHPSMKATLRIR